MNSHIIITLDGPAGVGKSSLACRVAQALCLPYLDTGAMFRTLAYMSISQVSTFQAADCSGLTFSLSGFGENSVLCCNGNPIGAEIRTEEVALAAARIGQDASVRDCLKKAQRALGEGYSLVCEGRDMGTVVFPAAKHKFFLDATAKVRAERRYKQLLAAQTALAYPDTPMHLPDIAVLTQQIIERDALDRGRSVAPLKAAADAHSIDTSLLTEEQVFMKIMRSIEQAS